MEESKRQYINQLILCELEQDLFGIDIMKTVEIIKSKELRNIPNSPYYFEGIFNLRGELIPVINIKKLFNFDNFDLTREKSIIIIKLHEKSFGIIIDKVLRVAQIDATELAPVPTGVKKEINQYVLGILHFEDQLISILNVEMLFESTDGNFFEHISSHEDWLSFSDNLHEIIKEKDEKAILNFLSFCNIKHTQLSWQGSLHYINDLSKQYNLTIQDVIKKIKNNLVNQKELDYHPFQIEKKSLLFDCTIDFELIKKVILLYIIPNKINTKKIRILNITNDHGEEITSVLILLENFIKNVHEWEIECTFVNPCGENPKLIEKNEFSSKHLKKINHEQRLTFFDLNEKNENLFSLKKEFLQKINFNNYNLDKISELEQFDLIFTRKILIQFENEEIFRILKILKDSLYNTGIIILSEIEDLTEMNKYFQTREFNRKRYFIKT